MINTYRPNYLPLWQGVKVLRAWGIAWASIGWLLCTCLLCNCTLAAAVFTPQTSAQVHPQPQITHQLDGLPFGRLFSTPAQRLQWDRTRLRQDGLAPQLAQEPSQTAGGGKGQGQPMRLSGVIMRDDGQQTLWLNGQIHHQSIAAPQRAVLGDRQQSQTLRVRMGMKGQALKPGQVLQPGRPVQEAYQNPAPRPVAVEAAAAPLAEPVENPAEPSKSAPQLKPAETGPAPASEDKPPGR